MHSVANDTAVSKPKVTTVRVEVVVDRLGHADHAQALLGASACAIASEPSPPTAIRASMPARGGRPGTSSSRAVALHDACRRAA